uniref:Aminotransferase-like plant mobile domain-containing protein n=1 Tax=Ananas comosus var. bracteatus TaxID=296719 RepID=A0A6V7QH47_ANACO|nr:unnamed protein product [Ananas comosus var. bracteatus]
MEDWLFRGLFLHQGKVECCYFGTLVQIWAWDHLHIGRPEVVGAQPELVDMPLGYRSKKLGPNKHTYEPRKRWAGVAFAPRWQKSNGSPADRDRMAQMLPGAACSCPADNITSATSQPQHHQPWNQSQIT